MNASNANVGDFELGGKSWLHMDDGVEGSRPSHCAACGLAAYRSDGQLRLHGHGRRSRTLWGPQTAEGVPTLWEVWMRRYRCTTCGSARTVQPPGLAARLRYSLCAIALALYMWAVLLWPASRVRAQVSPFVIVGASEVDRWRSLARWAARAAALFGLPAVDAPARQQAARATQLVRVRGPTDVDEPARVFIGAHAR